jgi:RimJ/RimL family protein N-acetyltransferase
MDSIRTERLLLRPYVGADAPRVLEVLSHPDVYPWLGDPPQHPMADLDAARAWIARTNAREKRGEFDIFRAIEVRETGVVAGTVLVGPMNRKDGTFHGEHEIGWHLHPDSWGRGYATESARAMLDHVFALGLSDIWCGMFVQNHASRAVAERLGLPFLGIQPDPWYEGDSPLFHVTAEEWAAS